MLLKILSIPKENFRIEKMQDTHSRAQLWRVFSEVAEVAEVSSIHFQNEKIEENKIHSENDRNKPQQPPTSAKRQRQDMPGTLEGDEKPHADIPQGDLPQEEEDIFRFKISPDVPVVHDEKPHADIPQGDLPQKKERVCFRFKPS